MPAFDPPLPPLPPPVVGGLEVGDTESEGVATGNEGVAGMDEAAMVDLLETCVDVALGKTGVSS